MKYLCLITLFAVLLISCNKSEESAVLPQCADTLFDLFTDENKNCEGAVVAIYNFEGEEVSVFTQGSCIADGSTSVFDEDCNEICFLGGIAGFQDCNGINFFDNASLVTIIWEK